jgi:hypothetical protein
MFGEKILTYGIKLKYITWQVMEYYFPGRSFRFNSTFLEKN